MAINGTQGYFKSSIGQQALFGHYDQMLAKWPMPYERLYLGTKLARTHVIACGDPAASPLLLFHGRSTNASIWGTVAPFLSRKHRVYAVDIPGEPGKSAAARPSGTSPAYGEWALDVLNALKVRQAAVMGISFGGWMTIKLAALAPERVRRAVLLCPAGLLFPRWDFIGMAALGQLGGARAREKLIDFIAHKPLAGDLRESFRLIFTHYQSNREAPPVFPDETLRRLTMPTLMLIGEHDRIFLAGPSVARARDLLPRGRAELIADAGHLLPYDQPQLVLTKALAFLQGA
ncbi:MAG: alpha/beta hydrolase [Chloroflexi bacterium]|nr:alpha/beta hydrolase [Chloroflexota bacterium]